MTELLSVPRGCVASGFLSGAEHDDVKRPTNNVEGEAGSTGRCRHGVDTHKLGPARKLGVDSTHKQAGSRRIGSTAERDGADSADSQPSPQPHC